MKIAVIGTGYVGLVTGTCFADTGNNVTCIDIDKEKVERFRKGDIILYEPGLEAIFSRAISQNRLGFTTDLKEGIKDAKVIFLALPTPSSEDGSVNMSYVFDVAHDLSNLITDYKVIVDKSTVPVGTAEKITEILSEKLDSSLFDVVSNPEFLKEGAAVADFMKPERVIIGSNSEKAKGIMGSLYEPFMRLGNRIIYMDPRSAEMTKYAANSYLATRITFMNEIANLCELMGADVDMVRRGIGTDSRIGKRFLFPGVGFGGSCFPKDVRGLIHQSNEHNYYFNILNSVVEVNSKQQHVLSQKILNHFGPNLSGKTIGIWGLSFKPNTDDIREAPALKIINDLLEHGAKIKAFDPEAMDNTKAILGDKIEFCNNEYEVAKDADALAVITEWSVFRRPSFKKLKRVMNKPVIFDGRNLYELKEMEEHDFYYESIGRKTVNN